MLFGSVPFVFSPLQGTKKASFSDACVFRYSFFKLRRQNRLCKICS